MSKSLPEDEQLIVLNLVEKQRANASDFTILNIINDYFEGTLYVVGYTDDTKKYEAIVFKDTGTAQLFANYYELNQFLYGKYKVNTSDKRFWKEAGVPAIIATLLILILALTLGLYGPKNVPDALWAILSAIIGFYFGNQTKSE